MDNKAIETVISCIDSECSLTDMFTKKEIQDLIAIDSSEFRAWIAKALMFEKDTIFAVPMLCKLLVDCDEVVRVESADSLAAFPTEQSYYALCAALADSSELVRAYAALGVAIIGKPLACSNTISLLQRQKQKEKSKYVLVYIYEGLYILDEHYVLSHLIELFYENDYHIQCAVLHALDEILDSNNCNVIESFISRIKADDYPTSVYDAAQTILKRSLNEKT